MKNLHRLHIIALIFVLGSTTCAFAKASEEKINTYVHAVTSSNLIVERASEDQQFTSHQVKAGETIKSIAEKFDVSEKDIYKFNPETDKQPSLFFSFSDENINNISRIAVNKNGTKIALVAEVLK